VDHEGLHDAQSLEVLLGVRVLLALRAGQINFGLAQDKRPLEFDRARLTRELVGPEAAGHFDHPGDSLVAPLLTSLVQPLPSGLVPFPVEFFDLLFDRIDDNFEHRLTDPEPRQPGAITDAVENEPDDEEQAEPLEGPPHARAQLLQVVPEGHARVPEEVLVVLGTGAALVEEIRKHGNTGPGGGNRGRRCRGWGGCLLPTGRRRGWRTAVATKV